MWTCRKALELTLSDVMINCNCFIDRDHSLLVFNKVSDSYFTMWMIYHFGMRSYMTKYVVVLRMIMMPSCPYFILSTPLSLNMWSYFSILASAWGQARSKLGGVDTSILRHAFMLIFIALWAVISHYGTIFMPFLSYFPKFTWRGRMPAARILDRKGANLRVLFYTTPNILKLYEKIFWNI